MVYNNPRGIPTATSILSLPTSSMLRMTFFSIFTSWDSFLASSGPNAPAVDLRKAWPRVRVVSGMLVVGLARQRFEFLRTDSATAPTQTASYLSRKKLTSLISGDISSSSSPG